MMKPVATIAKKRRPKKLDLVPSLEAVALFFYPRDHADAMDLLSIRHWALGIRKRIFWPSRPGSAPKPESPRLKHGLENHFARHLRLSGTAVYKGDWNLNDPQAFALRAEDSLDQKRISFGRDASVDQALQRAPRVTAKAACTITDFKTGNSRNVLISKSTKQPSMPPPIDDTPAPAIARTNDHVRFTTRIDQHGNHLRIMGKIGIQLNEARVTAFYGDVVTI
jgi:hypothetical protein